MAGFAPHIGEGKSQQKKAINQEYVIVTGAWQQSLAGPGYLSPWLDVLKKTYL